MGLSDSISRRFASNALAVQNPELLVALRGLKNKVWFVDSGADAGGNGASWDGAFQTLQAAVNASVANDTIFVATGHAENISAAAGLVINKAGLTIIGQGNGSARPTFTFITATTADVDIDSDNVTMVNLLFIGDITALAAPIDVNASDFTMIDCETRDLGTDICTDWIVMATASTHRLTLIRPTHRGTASDGGDTFLSIRVAADGCVIEDPWIDGNFDEGCIENVTAAATNLRIYGGQNRPGYLRTRGAEDLAIVLTATTTGDIGPNLFMRLTDDAANVTEAITVTTDCQLWPPLLVCNADAEQGFAYNGPVTADL